MGSNDYVQKPFSRAQVCTGARSHRSVSCRVTLRARAQLVARIDTHLRSRDGWMVENKRSNDLLGQVGPPPTRRATVVKAGIGVRAVRGCRWEEKRLGD